ncbi:MAG: hypothetical protein GY856_06510, partial [bacterium]|nr:hypothetical protein [bacterium]
WQTGTSSPLADYPGRQVLRPDNGWADLEPQTFDFEIPIDLAEGTPLYFRARVIDSQQAEATAENDPFLVADDAEEPRVDAVTVRAADGSEQLVYFIGDELYLEFRARDFETAVESVEVTFDRVDIFPSPIAATLVAGSDGRYRTATLTVPPDVFTDAAAIVATAAADDYGGNRGEQSFTFDVAAAPDPTAPSVEWLTPWQDAAWPADYTSVFTPQQGTPLLLRAAVSDVNLDDEGNEVPGSIVAVTFRGPVVNASGEIELAASWTAGEIVAGSEAPGSGTYQLLWWMPNQVAAGTELPFAVRAVDSGGRSTVVSAGMAVVTARRVYEGAIMSPSADDPMLLPEGDPNGPVFLLDGTLLSLQPRTDGGVRRLPAMYIYAGGQIDVGELVVEPTVLTAPEVTSYESADLFHPLELAIDEIFAVGHGCRVDLSERGLLGSTTEDSMVLPGEVGAEPWAGGSHGG